MTVLFMDSANGNDGATRWTTYGPATVLAGESPTGRAVYRLPSSTVSGLARSIPGTTSVLVSWYGRMQASGSDASTNAQQFQLFSGGTVRISLTHPADGAVRVRQGNGNGTILDTSGIGVIIPQTWHHYQVRAVLRNDSSGRIEVWVDGVQVINFTGSNAAAIVDVDSVRFGRTTAGSWDVSDISIHDSTTPIGVNMVWDMLPTGVGNNTDLSQEPNSGANWEKVDEPTPDGDTTYVYGDTEGDFDTYQMADLPAGTWNVLAVQTILNARKSDAGARFMRPVLRSGGVNYTGTSVPVADSYAASVEIFENDPDTSTAWTSSAVDALEVGPEVRDS